MNREEFLIARNPNPASRLPILLSIPVSGEPQPLVLATSDLWPGPRDLFCYQLDAWPAEAEILESIPVESCWRVGAAVHLILARRSQRRSIFVWTQRRGKKQQQRETQPQLLQEQQPEPQPVQQPELQQGPRQGRQTLVFWRSQESMRAARPGIRVPKARGLDQRPVSVVVDTHERYPWRFPRTAARTERRELPVGDYGVFFGDQLMAAIERKSSVDLAAALTNGRLGFQLAELSRLPRAALVVEGRLSDLVKLQKEQKVNAGWLLNVVAALQVEYPKVSWIFAENRSIAQDFAYRWLNAAVQALLDSVGAAGRRQTVFDEDVAVAQVAEISVAGYRPWPSPSVSASTSPLAPPSLSPAPRSASLSSSLSASSSSPASGPGDAQAEVTETSGLAFGWLWNCEMRRSEAVRLARAGQIWTVASYSQCFHVSAATAQHDLNLLVKNGELQVIDNHFDRVRTELQALQPARGRRPRLYGLRPSPVELV